MITYNFFGENKAHVCVITTPSVYCFITEQEGNIRDMITHYIYDENNDLTKEIMEHSDLPDFMKRYIIHRIKKVSFGEISQGKGFTSVWLA